MSTDQVQKPSSKRRRRGRQGSDQTTATNTTATSKPTEKSAQPAAKKDKGGGRHRQDRDDDKQYKKTREHSFGSHNNAGGSPAAASATAAAADAVGTVKLQTSLLLRDVPATGKKKDTAVAVEEMSSTTSWYDILSASKERNAVCTTTAELPSAAVVQNYRSLADQLYRKDVQLYNNSNSNSDSKDDQWMESTMRKGTLKDRIAAMSVMVSTHPLHKLYALDSLLYMTTGVQLSTTSTSNTKVTSSPNARVAQLAAEAMEDVFMNTLLPTHRQLIPLSKRPLRLYSEQGNAKQKTLSPRILLLWRVEEMILERFDVFVRHYIASTLQTDTTMASSSSSGAGGSGNNTNKTGNSNSNSNNTHPEVFKLAALKIAASLLRSVPQHEATLLQLIVNKLGDASAKVCAVAAHELRRTLLQHSNLAMQRIIAREVQQLAHRPHLSTTALYNCLCFLNQLKLSKVSDTTATSSSSSNGREEPSLAASLMTTYFRIFDMVLLQDSGAPSQQDKKSDKSKLGKKAASKQGKHSTPTATTATMVSQSRLIAALLQGVNRAHPYLPTADQDLAEHLDALYRVVHAASSPSARTQALLLLFHVAVGTTSTETLDDENNDNESSRHRSNNRKNRHHKQKQSQQEEMMPNPQDSSDTQNEAEAPKRRRDRFYRALYATLADPAMMGGGKKHLTMYFNLLYKSLKYDVDTVRVLAFAKRLLSMALHCPSPVLAAVIFLLDAVGQQEQHAVLRSCYVEVLYGVDAWRILDPTKREPSGALVVAAAADASATVDASTSTDNADMDTERRAPGWELALAKYHFHPSVQKFCATLGDDDNGNGTNAYSGDPLKDFALGPFLDKFAYRNPKSVERVAGRFKRGESVAERRSGTDSMIQAQFALPVNDPSYLTSSSSSSSGAATADHEAFFHTFFRERARRDALKGVVRHKSSNNEDDETMRRGTVDEYHRQSDALLDREEARDADQYMDQNVNYDDLESKWESDEEEEAFVDSLAQKIIDDAMESNMYALDALEDEDPDTEGWDDMYDDDGPDNNAINRGEDDDDDDDDQEEEDFEKSRFAMDPDEEYDSDDNDERLAEHEDVESDDEDTNTPGLGRHPRKSRKDGNDGIEEEEDEDDIDAGGHTFDEDDAFMDQDDDDDDDSDSADERQAAKLVDGDDGFIGGPDDDDDNEMELDDDEGDNDDDDEIDDDLALIGDDEDDDDENDDDEDLALIDDDDEEEDDEAPTLIALPEAGETTETFASADDYADLIAKSWSTQKRAKHQEQPVASTVTNSSKNKRKRKKGK